MRIHESRDLTLIQFLAKALIGKLTLVLLNVP
jgi:hypothetical protein